MRASDWIIDLGPEGGDGGGNVVFAGTPGALRTHPGSHTGRAIVEYEQALASSFAAPAAAVAEPQGAWARATSDAVEEIVIHNAREHNLKNVDVRIPRDKFTVITGVSGSGKSTLAFDILFNEGQRRYLESLNAYARQFVQPASRPDVDAIFGIPPTVAIEQRTSRGGRKSTVATLTEIYHFLRLLYVKLGTQYCPDCDVAIEPQSPATIGARLLRDYRGRIVTLLAPLVVARKGFYTDLAKWANKKGYRELRVDGVNIPTARWPRLNRFKEHTIELPVATLGVSAKTEFELNQALGKALDYGKGLVSVMSGPESQATMFSTRRACPSCGRSFAEPDPRMFSFNSKHGWCTSCFGTGLEIPDFDDVQTGEEIWWNDWFEREAIPCADCHGQRLNPVSLNVRFRKQSIAALAAGSIEATIGFFTGLKLSAREQEIARDLLAEISARLNFLVRVGLGYLQLDRAAPTLSGGEAQRIRLAAQLGSNLQGVCYVLDEPTIGLHPRDNAVLLDSLAELAAHRNTLVVVEHDEDTIRRADYVLDLGPGAGVRGGEVVGRGTVNDLIANESSVTGRFLRSPLLHPAKPRRPVTAESARLVLKGVTLHNVVNKNIEIPLGRLVVVTGVSGSGKSTVARDVLYTNLRRLVGEETPSGRARAAKNAVKRQAAAAHQAREQEEGIRQGQGVGGQDRGKCRARRAARGAHRLRGHRGRRTGPPCAGGRSDTHRQDPEILSCNLCGVLGRDPRHLRGHHRGAHPRLHREPLLVQLRIRPLRGLRWPGPANHRDELPARCESDLRCLQWSSLQF
ncbi:MAG: hypothetical protein WDM77_06605 [Steroidobacteraceae bacterium]